MEQYLIEFFESPLFGVTLTLIFFVLSEFLLKRFHIPLLNSMVLTTAFVIGFLVLARIPVESYQIGGSILTFFLGPATVALAIPLYRQFSTFKKYALPILGGLTVGVGVGLTSAILLAKFFGLDMELIYSPLPKNTTAPYAIEVSKIIGGLPALTVACVSIAGMFGSMMVPTIYRLIRVNDPVAMGIATGSASHAIGTAKIFETSEEAGAMSSMSIGLAGIITSFMIPLMIKIFLS